MKLNDRPKVKKLIVQVFDRCIEILVNNHPWYSQDLPTFNKETGRFNETVVPYRILDEGDWQVIFKSIPCSTDMIDEAVVEIEQLLKDKDLEWKYRVEAEPDEANDERVTPTFSRNAGAI